MKISEIILTTLLASLPPHKRRRPSERALAVAYLGKVMGKQNIKITSLCKNTDKIFIV